jgi:hypothetical protein
MLPFEGSSQVKLISDEEEVVGPFLPPEAIRHQSLRAVERCRDVELLRWSTTVITTTVYCTVQYVRSKASAKVISAAALR